MPTVFFLQCLVLIPVTRGHSFSSRHCRHYHPLWGLLELCLWSFVCCFGCSHITGLVVATFVTMVIRSVNLPHFHDSRRFAHIDSSRVVTIGVNADGRTCEKANVVLNPCVLKPSLFKLLVRGLILVRDCMKRPSFDSPCAGTCEQHSL